MRRLRIDPEMSRRLGEYSLSRKALVRFRTNLRFELEHLYQRYRSFRHPEDQRFFLYDLPIADGNVTHHFFFVIDDTTSPDDLFLIDFHYECHPN